MNLRKALFIGRFQPFHLGHLSVVEAIRNDGFDEVVIGIGSSQYYGTDENPLSAAERVALIAATLEHSTVQTYPHTLVQVPDIHNDQYWVKHVTALVNKYAGEFETVYTGNEWTRRLFEEAGVSVTPVTFVVDIAATDIRTMIAQRDESWREYIHPSIHEQVAGMLS